MYQQFFGLQEMPFSLAPDTDYFFRHHWHQEALNVLLFALHSGEGFVKIVGEVGTGKTLLCREFLNQLDDQYYPVYIPNPALSPKELHQAIAEELDIATDGMSDYALLKAINRRLIALNSDGQQVVVCVDETQAMPHQTLEALRLLSNLETEKRKLLLIVLFGQPELDTKLSQVYHRQLRQRIMFTYRLKPLDCQRVASYLDHRLRVAGYTGEPLFSRDAIQQLFKASAGVPRLINILSNKALLLAFGKGEHVIRARHVRAAVMDTEGISLALGWEKPLPVPVNLAIGAAFLTASLFFIFSV